MLQTRLKRRHRGALCGHELFVFFGVERAVGLERGLTANQVGHDGVRRLEAGFLHKQAQHPLVDHLIQHGLIQMQALQQFGRGLPAQALNNGLSLLTHRLFECLLRDRNAIDIGDRRIFPAGEILAHAPKHERNRHQPDDAKGNPTLNAITQIHQHITRTFSRPDHPKAASA